MARGNSTPSADSIDRQFGIAPDAAVQSGLTLIERRLMALLQSGANDSWRPAAIWEHPKLPELLGDLTAGSFLTDECLSELRSMRRFRALMAGGAKATSDDRSPDFKRWAEVLKQALAGLDRAIEEYETMLPLE